MVPNILHGMKIMFWSDTVHSIFFASLLTAQFVVSTFLCLEVAYWRFKNFTSFSCLKNWPKKVCRPKPYFLILASWYFHFFPKYSEIRENRMLAETILCGVMIFISKQVIWYKWRTLSSENNKLNKSIWFNSYVDLSLLVKLSC